MSPSAVMPKKRILPWRRRRVEGGHHLIEHRGRVDGAGSPVLGDQVVELEQVDALEAEAAEARLEGRRHRLGGAAARLVRDADLGADDHVRPERLEDAAEVLLRLAVAVDGRGVEVVDAERERPRHRPLLVGGGAAHHEPAHGAAAEAEHRDLDAGLAEYPSLHDWLPRCCRNERVLVARAADLVQQRTIAD